MFRLIILASALLVAVSATQDPLNYDNYISETEAEDPCASCTNEEWLAEKCRHLPELSLPLSCPANRIGRTRDCPALSCQQIYDLNTPHSEVKDGVYYLHVLDKREREVVFPTFCLMSKGGYTMVAKIPSYSHYHYAARIWTHKTELNEGHRDLLQMDLPAQEPERTLPYKNRLVRHWTNAWPWTEALVTLMKDGEIAQYLKFNVTGTVWTQWFLRQHLIESSWRDLKDAEQVVFFNMYGDPTLLDRSFFLSSDHYGNCEEEVGWMVATGKRSGCPWERPEGLDNFHGVYWLYSTLPEMARFKDVGNTVAVADSLVILLR